MPAAEVRPFLQLQPRELKTKELKKNVEIIVPEKNGGGEEASSWY